MQRNKKLEKLRKGWSKPIDKYRNLDLISFYHTNIFNSKDKYVDETTWKDLNFDDIFSIIDRNSCPIGQQYLYHILHKYEVDEKVLKSRLYFAEYFKKNSSQREAIQLALLKLDETNTNFIAPLIFGELPDRPKFYQMFWVMSYLAIISFILIFINSKFFFLAMGVFLINLIINHIYSKNIHKYFAGFSSLNELFIVVQKINKTVDIDHPEFNFLKKQNSLIKKINKKIGSFVIDKASMNDMLAGMVDYLNIYFLYDLKKYSRSIGLIRKYQLEIQQIFNSIGIIDSAISIASYLEMVPWYSTPIKNNNNSLKFEDIFHPLIPDAVSINLEGINKSAIITGSNMAGKTTFIKTVGVNIILAQTLNICLAKSSSIQNLIVMSSIKREDNLEDSKSYFYVEIEEIQKFLKISETNNNYLFIIDEIFRGTNTLERLAASTAVLEYLNRKNKVFVTTHDIELQDLLKNSFEIFHFSEQVEGNNFFFDYKLRRGPTTSGNAIKLLELKGYPKFVVNKAAELKDLFLLKSKSY